MVITSNSKITKAQYQVLRLIKQGNSIAEISKELGKNYYTVRAHMRNLRNKGLVKTARGRRSEVTVDLTGALLDESGRHAQAHRKDR